jgi:hypothetical protein
MSVLLREDLAKTSHLLNELGEEVKPISLCGLFTVDFDMLPKRVYRGVRINTLSFLWPEKDLRDAAIDCAKDFVAKMKKQREEYTLVGNEADVELWGPYRWGHKPGYGVSHTKGSDDPFPNGQAAFRLRGYFTARYAVMMPVEADGSPVRRAPFLIDPQYGGIGL